MTKSKKVKEEEEEEDGGYPGRPEHQLTCGNLCIGNRFYADFVPQILFLCLKY